MNPFTTGILGPLHHFYLVEGESVLGREALLSFLTEDQLPTEIILDEWYESLDVAASEVIHGYQTIKTAEGTRKILIVRTQDITSVAEHALLKMCEEPARETHIFIFLPNISGVPDTVRSRAHIIRLPKTTGESDIQAVTFMKVNKNERIDMIAEIIKKHKDTETSAPLRAEAMEFVCALEGLLHKTYTFPYTKEQQEHLQILLSAQKYLSTSGASVKMILEGLALVL